MRKEREKISVVFRVTIFEDPAYHALTEKIVSNKSLLLKQFEKADRKKTGSTLIFLFFRKNQLNFSQIIYR